MGSIKGCSLFTIYPLRIECVNTPDILLFRLHWIWKQNLERLLRGGCFAIVKF